MFQVDWFEAALNELATLWMESDSGLRQVITEATNRLDQALETNPLSQGESREGNRRITFAYPLGVKFAVSRAALRGLVLHVWDIRRRC